MVVQCARAGLHTHGQNLRFHVYLVQIALDFRHVYRVHEYYVIGLIRREERRRLDLLAGDGEELAVPLRVDVGRVFDRIADLQRREERDGFAQRAPDHDLLSLRLGGKDFVPPARDTRGDAVLEIGGQRGHLGQIVLELQRRARRRIRRLGGDQQILIAVVALQLQQVEVVGAEDPRQ